VSSNGQETNKNSSINSTRLTAQDQNVIDELDEIGVNDNNNNLKQRKDKKLKSDTQDETNPSNIINDISDDVLNFLQIKNKPNTRQQANGGMFHKLKTVARNLIFGVDKKDDSLDQMVEGIVQKNNSTNSSFINEDDKMYENDPKIFNKETKMIRMLCCKIPNAFIYARNFQTGAIGYVKVISNSMGPSEAPAWQIAGKKICRWYR
jgi:hypothetical protein